MEKALWFIIEAKLERTIFKEEAPFGVTKITVRKNLFENKIKQEHTLDSYIFVVAHKKKKHLLINRAFQPSIRLTRRNCNKHKRGT